MDLTQTQIPPTFLAPTLLAKDIYHIVGSTLITSTINTQIVNISTTQGSTIQCSTLQFNTLFGSTIQTNILSTNIITGSTIQVNIIVVNSSIQISTTQASTIQYITLLGSTINTVTLQTSSLTGSTIQTNTLSTNIITANTIQSNVLQTNSLTGSTIQSNVLQMNNFTGNTTQTNTITTSSLVGSTLQLDILQVSTLSTKYLLGSTSQIRLLQFSTLSGSTIQTNIFNASTLMASTIQMDILNISTLNTLANVVSINTLITSTITGSTLILNKLHASTINISSSAIGSTCQTLLLNDSSIIGSTIQIQTLQISTLYGNNFLGKDIQAGQFNVCTIIGSTIQTNNLQVSTLLGSSIQAGQLINASTTFGSTIQTNLLNTSAIVGNIIQTGVLNTSTIFGMVQINITQISTNNFISTIFGATIQLSTLKVSTINGSTIQNNIYITSTTIGSTIKLNTLQTNIIGYSSIIGSTFQIERWNINTISSSTMIGNNFQPNKIIITNDNKALSTSAINASQLQYITNLTSYASGTGQNNSWYAPQTFSTSSIYFNGITTNTPSYTLGLNASNQLIQYTNTSVGSIKGILTPNYIPYAYGVSTVRDSIIYRVSATDLAIGQTTSAFPTSTTFNYTNIDYISGDYLTFDLGTGGNLHNQYSQSDYGYTKPYKIQFLGSDNATTWISLGISVDNGSGVFSYTQNNRRYLRLVIKEVYITILTTPLGLFFHYPSVSNNGSTNLLTTLSQVVASINFTINSGYTTTIQSILVNTSVYSPQSNNIVSYYNGSITMTLSEVKTGTAIVTVAGLTQTTTLTTTTCTISKKIFMDDKRSGLNGTLIPGNKGCNFYLGTMNNNGSGNISDVLYLNSWWDSSAGNINVVMFDKYKFGMRIYQGAIGATSNFTSYRDVVFKPYPKGLELGQGSDTNAIVFGPNATWSSYLKIGAGHTIRPDTNIATVFTTNGDLHLAAATNTRGIYLNHYNQLSRIYSWTPWTHYNDMTITGDCTSSSYIKTADWYYMNGAGGMWFSAYSRGISSPENEGNSYGNVCAYPWNGRNSWAGWGLTSIGAYMGYNNTEFGIHSNYLSWLIYCNGDSVRSTRLCGSVVCSQGFNRLSVFTNGYDGYFFYVNSGGGYAFYSDERAKKNIVPVDPKLSMEFIDGVVPSYFCLKQSKSCTQTNPDGKEETVHPSVCTCEQAGFIAQNVLDVIKKTGLPKSTINNWYDYEQQLLLPDEKRTALLGISQVPLVAHLVNGLKIKMQKSKEQQEQIRLLQFKLDTYRITLNNIHETVKQQSELIQQFTTKV